MFSLSADLAGALDALARLQAELPASLETGVTGGLAGLIQELEPVTPVRSGKMQQQYATTARGGVYELIDTAESPRGYGYPGRVIFDPGFSQAHDALNAVLDGAEARIEDSVAARLHALIP